MLRVDQFLRSQFRTSQCTADYREGRKILSECPNQTVHRGARKDYENENTRNTQKLQRRL